MTQQFSAVLLGNLNDFIAPGQACVNPIFTDAPAAASVSSSTTKKRIELSFDMTGGGDVQMAVAAPAPSLIKLDAKSKAAKVSLSDCLACSGCVTTAETVLLKAQSVQEFSQQMESIRAGLNPKYSSACVTLAPQVLASLAVRFSTPVELVRSKLTRFFKQVCGVHHVLDAAGLPAYLAQLEVAQEFVQRYRGGDNQQPQARLPMLTSSCPGWVCYAEKTLGRQVLDHLSEAKSPQQVAGVLIKKRGGGTRGVYHVSIMPCPDKKLEASRKEFQLKEEDGDDTEVNCVLTATEVCDLVLQFDDNGTATATPSLDDAFAALPLLTTKETELSPLEREFGINVEEPMAGNSGSLCAFVFRYACRELFGVDLPVSDGPLPFKRGRNADTSTLELQLEGRVVLSFATSYGFRNIQEVGRKVRQGQLKAHFVEVMACPSGCVNGGGLMPSNTSSSGVVEGGKKSTLADRVSKVLDCAPRRLVHSSETAVPADWLRTTFNDIKDAAPANELMQEW